MSLSAQSGERVPSYQEFLVIETSTRPASLFTDLLQFLPRCAVGLAEISVGRLVEGAIVEHALEQVSCRLAPTLEKSIFAQIERGLAALLTLDHGILVSRRGG
jgi:hypothetical protein